MSAAAPPTSGPPAALDRARVLVEPVMRAAIDTLVDDLRGAASYQMGWTDAAGNAVPGGGGKGVRPALAVVSAEAVGSPATVALPGAAAVELIHNFSLVHDDIIDGDTARRHRPTLWTVCGSGDAIIVGDAMHTLAFELLMDVQSPAAMDAARRLATSTSAMIAGQSADMSFERRDVVTFEDCIEMEANKTGALLSYAASVGAVLAGAPVATIDGLSEFGAAVGIAFQAVDDVLGIWGDPEVTGKAAGNDLRERKRSMPVTAAMMSGGANGDAIADLYAREELTEADITELAERIEQAGGRTRTLDEARGRTDVALRLIEETDIERSARAELIELAEFIVGRDF